MFKLRTTTDRAFLEINSLLYEVAPNPAVKNEDVLQTFSHRSSPQGLSRLRGGVAFHIYSMYAKYAIWKKAF
jgi:hypothetical protein